MKSDIWLAYLCFFGLPLLAIGLIGFCSYQAALGTGMSPCLAAFLGIVGGTIFLGTMIASSGGDMTDFAVSSLIIIVLMVLLVPVFTRARENAHKKAIRQALRQQKANYAQATKKGPQLKR